MVSHESCHRQFALTGFTRIERMDLRMKIALLDGVCNENDVSGLFKVAAFFGYLQNLSFMPASTLSKSASYPASLGFPKLCAGPLHNSPSHTVIMYSVLHLSNSTLRRIAIQSLLSWIHHVSCHLSF